MSQTTCRHGDKAENMRLAEEKRERRRARNQQIMDMGRPGRPIFTRMGTPFTSKRSAMRRKVRQIIKRLAWRDFLRINKGMRVFRKTSFAKRLQLMEVTK